MSPKKITRLGLMVVVVSIIGIIPMIFLRSGLGLLSWWPAAGLAVGLLLFVAAYIKGAYLTAQRRAEMVDMLNDCYSGTTEKRERV
jgi:hypothetical protein